MEWKDPPPVRSWGLAAEAAELRRQPGRWGMIAVRPRREMARKQKERIINGRNAAFRPAWSFQAAVFQRDDGKWELYARYIGGEGEYATASTVHWAGTGPGSGSEDRPADAGAGSEVDLHGTA